MVKTGNVRLRVLETRSYMYTLIKMLSIHTITTKKINKYDNKKYLTKYKILECEMKTCTWGSQSLQCKVLKTNIQSNSHFYPSIQLQRKKIYTKYDNKKYMPKYKYWNVKYMLILEVVKTRNAKSSKLIFNQRHIIYVIIYTLYFWWHEPIQTTYLSKSLLAGVFFCDDTKCRGSSLLCADEGVSLWTQEDKKWSSLRSRPSRRARGSRDKVSPCEDDKPE